MINYSGERSEPNVKHRIVSITHLDIPTRREVKLMISTHCGVRLEYLYGRFKDTRCNFHQWICPVCKRKFKQHVRQTKEKKI